ncbi:glycoside hydrolase family 73 protein [Streptococcus dentasini]
MRTRLKFRPFIIVFGFVLALILLPLLFNMRTKAANTKVVSHYSQEAFIKEVAPTAQKLSKAYGVKASIIIAQMAQSSDYGSNLLAVRYHNYTGMLAQSGQARIVLTTQSYESGQWRTVKQPYAIYTDWQSSLSAYMEALSSGLWGTQLYTTVATAEEYTTAVQALQKAGVSPDPHYADKLTAIIQKHQLTKYDK